MSVGDRGPYVNDDGDVWVPRTVPYRRAFRVAHEADSGDFWMALHYVGKDDADLLGFSRDCRCDEVCEASYTDDEPNGTHPCRVPAWHFRQVER